MKLKNVRVLLVGCGHWGYNHYKTLSAIGANFKVYDIKTGCTFGRDGVDNTRAVGNNEDEYDAVIIATESVKHFELTKFYWEKGFSVLCEKPVVKNKEELNELVQLVKSRPEQTFMAGHTLMYHPAVLHVINYANSFDNYNVILRRMKHNPIYGEDEIYRLAPHDLSVLDRMGLLGGEKHRIGNTLYFTTAEGHTANVVVSWRQSPPIRDFYVKAGNSVAYFNDYEETLMIDDKRIDYDMTPPLMREQIAFLSTVCGLNRNHSELEHTFRVYNALTDLREWTP